MRLSCHEEHIWMVAPETSPYAPWSCEKIVSVGAGRCAGPSRYSRKSWKERGLGATWNATAGVPYSHPAISSQLPFKGLQPIRLLV
jgi:hypothetical protein